MSKLAKALTAAAGNAGESLYVEDVFSTYLYTGNGSTQTITNGIDLDGEGGLSWIKSRSNAQSHALVDTERGANKRLITNLTGAEFVYTDPAFYIQSAFNSNGFDIGPNSLVNASGYTYASWTFRKAEKFFDVVTYTGNGTTQAISHNLGVAPAFIIVKETSAARDWPCYHSSLGETYRIFLNATNAVFNSSSANVWGNNTTAVAPTSTEFTVGNTPIVNESGQTYVAYLFASDAGGFGDDGSESIIKCGSYTGTGAAGNEVNLGFEPQWLMVKRTDSTGGWVLFDNMRGFPVDGSDLYLYANSSAAEGVGYDFGAITATGFVINQTSDPEVNASGGNYIYIAIRRPMKTPESGTEVFAIDTADGSTLPQYKSGFVTDMALRVNNVTATHNNFIYTRLTQGKYLRTEATDAEGSSTAFPFDYMNGYCNLTSTDSNNYSWMFKRATGFFDVVAYTGDGTNKVIPHNLGVKPELIITKPRSNPTSSATDWIVYAEPLTNSNFLYLNSSSAAVGAALYPSEPTADNYTVLGGARIGDNGGTNISYLFATLDGVSKVGSYTGTGSNVDVDCGFSSGARFILIKRTDSTGDWYVWDSARGIVAGNDPYLLLNSTAAEVTSTDYIDPLASGFTVTSSAPAALNASGGNYIFLAIA